MVFVCNSQGFSQLNLTPFEEGRVLAQAAHRLGIPQIPDEYLKEGCLGEILIPDDYKPLQNVSKLLFTFLGVQNHFGLDLQSLP